MTPEVAGNSRLKELDQERYDALVVMPYSSNIGSNGNIRLSYWSAQSVHAGFHLWKKDIAQGIIIPGESTFGTDKTSTTELMSRYLIAKQIPKSIIFCLENLNNTVEQLDIVKAIQEQDSLINLLVVCCNSHEQRVKNVMEKLGITGDTVEVEAILESEHTSTDRDVLLSVPATQKQVEKDKMILNNPILSQLWLQRLLSKVIGPRVVDLHDDTYARFKKG